MCLEKVSDKIVPGCAFSIFSYSKSGKNFSLQTTSGNNLSNPCASPKDVVIGWGGKLAGLEEKAFSLVGAENDARPRIHKLIKNAIKSQS